MNEEIDHHTQRFTVGLIAIGLATITDRLSPESLTSISEAYWSGDWSRNVFVGSLFAIAAFLFSYNGITRTQKYMSKAAALFAIGIAIFPCACRYGTEVLPYVHYICAALMFSVLAYFCLVFRDRAKRKFTVEAKVRANVYLVSALVMISCMCILLLDVVTDEYISERIPRLVYFGEAVALFSFGVAWLTASRMLPVLTDKSERYSMFK